MIDNFVEGLQFQVALVIVATAVIALLIVGATAWGWWKWKQLVRRARRENWPGFGQPGALTVSRFAASRPPGGSGNPPPDDAALADDAAPAGQPDVGGTAAPAPGFGSGQDVTAAGGTGSPRQPSFDDRTRALEREVSEETAPPPTRQPGAEERLSEARELFEQAFRFATVRARELGERLRPEIDRAQQRLEESGALRETAARLRAVRDAWDRPAPGDAPDVSMPPPDATGDTAAIARRLDELLQEQRTTNELLRSLLERLGRT